jgi:hypothetical protein
MRSVVLALAATGCGVIAGIDVTAPPTTTERSTNFELDNQTGTLTSLSELLARGDVALIFFRGHW